MKKPTLSHFFVFALASSVLAFVPPASLGGVHRTTLTWPGTGYAQISGYYPGPPNTGDPADEGQGGCTWYPAGHTAIFTTWSHGGDANHQAHCLWVLYMAELSPGYWRLGLNAKNVGRIKNRQWYPRFEVLVELEGPAPTRPQRAIVYVPAVDEGLRSGQQFFLITQPGLYGIRYTWLNDLSECTDPDHQPGEPCSPEFWYDVNIMIDSVFFDRASYSRRVLSPSGAPLATTR